MFCLCVASYVKIKMCIPHQLVYHMTLRSVNHSNYNVISTPQCHITHHILQYMFCIFCAYVYVFIGGAPIQARLLCDSWHVYMTKIDNIIYNACMHACVSMHSYFVVVTMHPFVKGYS